MSSELISLTALFQNRLFRIPDYQRGYAWKKAQLEDFWEDLLNIQNDRYHYTGLLSLKEMNKEDLHEDDWLTHIGYKALHIVDGQQRLTTFLILMYELVTFVSNLEENQGKSNDEIYIEYESIKEIKEKYIVRKRPPENMVKTYMFSYDGTDNPSSHYLKHKIFEEPYGGNIVETYYTQNLKFAKNFFARQVNSLHEEQGLDGIKLLYKHLTSNLKFNVHEIEDNYDVYVAFETMNNRGKSLSNLELLKNRLIYLTTLFDHEQLDEKDKAQLRKNVNDAWKEIYYQLGRNQHRPLQDDRFLRAHWTIYYKYTRRKGDDYIHFLLNKFSPRNVFDKHTVKVENEVIEWNDEEEFEDEDVDDPIEEPVLISKLVPKEINNYVNSLKDFAEHWYYSYFPYEHESLSLEEKRWINRLNRVGITYFRPLVAITLSLHKKTNEEERILLLQEIERFIFLCFRVAGFNASYKSSYYYNKARNVLQENISLKSVADDLMKTIDSNINTIISGFISKTGRLFDAGTGFYNWRGLRYFLYEYESKLSHVHNIQKVDWHMFSRVEKDQVTIEHVLPQTPTKWYWRNQFRQYNEEEIKLLSASLGNLLPLAQSINASLQNDGFYDKKSPSSKRRGYIKGSHSEIEVATNEDWNAETILERGLSLLEFMEDRWKFSLSEEEKLELLHIQFVNDDREVVPEIPKPKGKVLNLEEPSSKNEKELTKTEALRYDFWRHFVDYCHSIGRGKDVASQTPSHVGWYDVTIGSKDYHIFFQVLRQNILRIGVYVHKQETFDRLEAVKDEIEEMYGYTLEWYTSRETSTAKRIIHSIEIDVFNQELYRDHFKWMVSQFDKLKAALNEIDTNLDGSDKRSRRTMITSEMVGDAYEVAKKVFNGELGRTEGRDEIVDRVNMNSGSAGDFISAFYAMMNGERYTRTLNEYSTRYFLEHIKEDYGSPGLQKALEACQKHATYYASFGKGRLAYVERMIAEYEDEIIKKETK